MTGLYVHVPFCARRCPYCDFDFVVGRVPDVDGWLTGMRAELAARAGELEGLAPRTLYVGGGTPSLVGADGIAAMLSCVRASMTLDALREVTVELNPEHVDDASVAALAQLGVDRVSLGVQSFEPQALALLGRMHDPAQAMRALDACTRAGLRTSVDLIVGWPAQSAAALARDLERVVDSGVEHVSIYALTIEAGTPWPKLVRRGLRTLPDDDAQADALLQAERALVDAGFEHYEVASYARAGAWSQHNTGYWTRGDFVGLGPSAGSARYAADGSLVRRTNARGTPAWARGEAPEIEALTREQAARESAWLGLRLLGGLDEPRWRQAYAGAIEPATAAAIEAAVRAGDLQRSDGARLRVHPQRWLRHDAIAAALLATRAGARDGGGD